MYKPEGNRRLDGLSLSQVQAIVGSLSRAEQMDWWLWKEGWTEWKPVSNAPEALQSLPLVAMEPPPPLPNENSDFVLRIHQRYVRKYKVEIERGTKCFRTHSINISAGGILLEEPVPEWVVGYCQVRVYKNHPDECMELACAVADNQPPGQRYRLEFSGLQTEFEKEQFEKWIAAA